MDLTQILSGLSITSSREGGKRMKTNRKLNKQEEEEENERFPKRLLKPF